MVVATAGLTRRFGLLKAVDDLTLDLPTGGVAGLVGPNGSGKSTLIRMLLGLIKPTSGQAEILGRSIAAPQSYAGSVGALVEGPAFVAGLSARANLMSLARLRGLPASRVDEVVSILGLAGRDREPVKRFSLGLKQRLGIAAALLPDPELLILDAAPALSFGDTERPSAPSHPLPVGRAGGRPGQPRPRPGTDGHGAPGHPVRSGGESTHGR